MKDFEFTVSCGCIKKGKCWEIKDPKANIVIFEGMEEHVSRYEKFGDFLNKQGFSVYALDTFGQGENVLPDLSNLGVWPKGAFQKQLMHFHDLVVDLKEKYNVPVFIFSHSMGSFYGQAYLFNYPGEADKICLCGAGGKNPAVGLGKVLASMICTKKKEQERSKFIANLMFGAYNKKIENVETEFDWLSWNKDNVNRYIEDPLCGYGPRNRFCVELFKGMLTLYKKDNLKKLSKDTATFLISGDGDPVTAYGRYTKELTEMYKKYGVKDVSYKIYDHMRHEILNEVEWQQVAKDVSDFFSKGL